MSLKETDIELGLALFSLVQKGLATLERLKESDPEVFAEIEARGFAAEAAAQAALDSKPE